MKTLRPLLPMARVCTTLAAASMALACTATPPASSATTGTPPPAQAANRVWMLVAMPGFDKATLVHHKAQMDWSRLPQGAAHMGCNHIGYRAQLGAGGKLEVGQMFSTRMACPNMRLEGAFSQLLPTMTQAKLHGHRLTLRNAAGAQMDFVAADWD